MRSGRLKSTIILSRRGPSTTSGAGKKSATWTPYLTIRAETISSDARTFIAEAGEGVQSAVVFRVRFRPGIEAGDRVTLGDRDLDLAEIKQVVAGRVLELRCTGGMS